MLPAPTKHFPAKGEAVTGSERGDRVFGHAREDGKEFMRPQAVMIGGAAVDYGNM